MRKSVYLVMAAAAAGMMASCTGKAGYVVTGTVEGAEDGETVYLTDTVFGRQSLDSTVIKNGTFAFKGVHDSTSVCYVVYNKDGVPYLVGQFFLESGKINVDVKAGERAEIGGTFSNDTYQGILNQIIPIEQRAEELYKSVMDTALADEEKVPLIEEIGLLGNQKDSIYADAVRENITNPVGIYLFKETFQKNSTEENEALLEQIPVEYLSDPALAFIKELIEKEKRTAVGTHFTDFEMQTPEGATVKLSDYAGKGKVILVDFWASWCGPCRQEMPNVINLYNKYKNRNFDIVGVSLDNKESDWKEAIKELKMPWVQVSDLKGGKSECTEAYAITSIPNTVLIDGEGTIIARGLRGEELQSKLEEIL